MDRPRRLTGTATFPLALIILAAFLPTYRGCETVYSPVSATFNRQTALIALPYTTPYLVAVALIALILYGLARGAPFGPWRYRLIGLLGGATVIASGAAFVSNIEDVVSRPLDAILYFGWWASTWTGAFRLLLRSARAESWRRFGFLLAAWAALSSATVAFYVVTRIREPNNTFWGMWVFTAALATTGVIGRLAARD